MTKFETKIDSLIPAGEGPFRITAFELTHDGETWSVNTPFNIGDGLDRQETISRLRGRWEIFKANYMPKVRVKDLCNIGDSEDTAQIEVDCTAFADVQKIPVD